MQHILLDNLPFPFTFYSSSRDALPSRSSMAIILTTRLVQPVKCCVRCPAPVSGLYCSHAKPVSFQLLYTVFTRFLRKRMYRSRAFWL